MRPTVHYRVLLLLFFLISTCRADHPKHQRSLDSRQFSQPPYWEHILREYVFKTISPPPPGNNALYKRLLEAPFYGGPFPSVSNEEVSVVLSRGNVFHLANGRWLLCQEGCIDCEVCIQQRDPTVKWVLRRIKRISFGGSPRYDLQLTIIPQPDESYHMKNLWPRSYVYVASQGEQAAYFRDEAIRHDPRNAFLNETPSHRDSFWRLLESEKNDSTTTTTVKSTVPIGESNSTTTTTMAISTRESVDKSTRESSVTTSESEKQDQRSRLRNVRKRPRLRQRPSQMNGNDTAKGNDERFVPRLILGTDQEGQKHLVHVVPAEYPYVIPTTLNTMVANEDSMVQDKEKPAYQRIFRRIFDSLNTHRVSIENFLGSTGNKIVTDQEVGQSDDLNKSGVVLSPIWRSYEGKVLDTEHRLEDPVISLAVEMDQNPAEYRRRETRGPVSRGVGLRSNYNVNKDRFDLDLARRRQLLRADVRSNNITSQGRVKLSSGSSVNLKNIQSNSHPKSSFSPVRRDVSQLKLMATTNSPSTIRSRPVLNPVENKN